MRNVHGWSNHAWECACENGHTSFVKFLLKLTGDRRINVHDSSNYCWHVACCNGHTDVVKLLLKLTGDRRIEVHTNNEAAWRYACENGHTDVAQLLLTAGADRLPGRDAFEEGRDICRTKHHYELQPYEYWVWRNDPRMHRMLQHRAALAVRSGLGWMERCCEDGRPLQLEHSLFNLGAVKALDRRALEGWRQVAL